LEGRAASFRRRICKQAGSCSPELSRGRALGNTRAGYRLGERGIARSQSVFVVRSHGALIAVNYRSLRREMGDAGTRQPTEPVVGDLNLMYVITQEAAAARFRFFPSRGDHDQDRISSHAHRHCTYHHSRSGSLCVGVSGASGIGNKCA